MQPEVPSLSHAAWGSEFEPCSLRFWVWAMQPEVPSLSHLAWDSEFELCSLRFWVWAMQHEVLSSCSLRFWVWAMQHEVLEFEPCSHRVRGFVWAMQPEPWGIIILIAFVVQFWFPRRYIHNLCNWQLKHPVLPEESALQLPLCTVLHVHYTARGMYIWLTSYPGPTPEINACLK